MYHKQQWMFTAIALPWR